MFYQSKVKSLTPNIFVYNDLLTQSAAQTETVSS